MNFSEIYLKFAIVFKVFEFFLSFSEFIDHYWPSMLFKPCRWVNITSETKIALDIFTGNLKALFLNLQYIANFENISFLFDLFS